VGGGGRRGPRYFASARARARAEGRQRASVSFSGEGRNRRAAGFKRPCDKIQHHREENERTLLAPPPPRRDSSAFLRRVARIIHPIMPRLTASDPRCAIVYCQKASLCYIYVYIYIYISFRLRRGFSPSVERGPGGGGGGGGGGRRGQAAEEEEEEASWRETYLRRDFNLFPRRAHRGMKSGTKAGARRRRRRRVEEGGKGRGERKETKRRERCGIAAVRRLLFPSRSSEFTPATFDSSSERRR